MPDIDFARLVFGDDYESDEGDDDPEGASVAGSVAESGAGSVGASAVGEED